MSKPVFDITLAPFANDSTVLVNGEDISSALQGVSVECMAGEVTKLTLHVSRSQIVRVKGAIDREDVALQLPAGEAVES